MSTIFSEYEAKKQELGCNINVIPIINYFEKLFGYQKTCEMIEPLGLPVTYLKNKRNWVSYKYYCALLDKLVEVTDDKNSPFNAVFSAKPDSVFQELLYATYSSLFFTSPGNAYKVALSKDFSQRYTKIGFFEFITSTRNSITVKLNLLEGYQQTKNNCLAIQGFMTSATLPWGVPPAKVEHLECATKGASHCIYKINWETRIKNWKTYIIPLMLIPLLSFEILFYNKFFDFKDILLTVGLDILIYFIFKIYQYKNEMQSEKIFNYEKNNTVLNAMEKIESDYNEILETKIKLEERNIFLTIINEINKAIITSYGFDHLLLYAGKVLSEQLKIDRALYFQFNFRERIFSSLFEVDYNKNAVNALEINYTKLDLPYDNYREIKKLKYSFNADDINGNKGFFAGQILDWLDPKEGKAYHILPVEIPDTLYLGFFILFGDKNTNITSDFYNTLFDGITDLLKIGYQKISSRYVIESILSSIPSSVLIFDINKLEVKYINAMFARTFGGSLNLSEDKIVGMDIFDILPFDSENRQKLVDSLESIVNGHQAEKYEINIYSNIYEYSLFNISQFGHEERLVGIVLNDVTEAKYFQQKLLINEKLVALGKVASGIAHEINNPLYAILANAEEIAENEKSSTDTKQYAEEMIEHVMNVSNIIKDLSSYSKTLRKEISDDINLNDIIDESLKLVRYSSNFLEVEIRKNLVKLPLIKATKGEMEQVFINLFNNAIQAMNGKGVLTINSAFENNEIVISIADNGPGIKKEIIPHIFDLYFTTKVPGEGTGQGLHIVRKILTGHHGTINVESEEGKGTVFYIRFNLDKIVKVKEVS